MPASLTFLSTVHPHPWSPTKGAFNRAMLRGLSAHMDVRAVVPVPWTERIRRGMPMPATSYDVASKTFYYLPGLDRLALARRMRRSFSVTLAREPVPDVVLSYWADPDGTVALDWARSINRPLVQIVGGSDVLLMTGDANRRDRIRTTLLGADAVLTIGNRVHQAVLELGVPPERVRLFRRGVDRSRFSPAPSEQARERLGLPTDRPVLLWVGRMVPVKGLDTLLRAIASLEVAQHRPLLVLVGDGPLRNRFERLVRQLALSSDVLFAGQVGHDDLPSWYAAADRLVLPSLSEGVPNVLLEGLACGRRFFASDVGSVAELTDDPRDLLPPGDAVEWSARLTAWLAGARTEEPVTPVPDAAESAANLAKLLNEVAAVHRR